jgi:hypothetical protein
MQWEGLELFGDKDLFELQLQKVSGLCLTFAWGMGFQLRALFFWENFKLCNCSKG